MSIKASPLALRANEVAPRTKPSNYPEPFFTRMARREKRPLGDAFGLENFGVNLTRLLPGGVSSLRHAHSRQDEFVYVLEGYPSLITDRGEVLLEPGMVAGFRAGTGESHQLLNKTDDVVILLEVGDRTANDEVTYSEDDLRAILVDGRWKFVHKDGTAY
jgi:uncharacterized cupin superfamily protein